MTTFHLFPQLHQRLSAPNAYYKSTGQGFYLVFDNFAKQCVEKRKGFNSKTERHN